MRDARTNWCLPPFVFIDLYQAGNSVNVLLTLPCGKEFCNAFAIFHVPAQDAVQNLIRR